MPPPLRLRCRALSLSVFMRLSKVRPHLCAQRRILQRACAKCSTRSGTKTSTIGMSSVLVWIVFWVDNDVRYLIDNGFIFVAFNLMDRQPLVAVGRAVSGI